MSDYTITLKRCCDVYGKDTILNCFKSYNLENYLTGEQIETIYNTSIFNKNILADMILNHYYFREIAFETPEMFIHYANNRMNEIMRNLCTINLFSFFNL